MYKIIVFDLDDTLSESKTKADSEMLELISKLLNKYNVAIISGGVFEQIGKQVFNHFDQNKIKMENFYVFPTVGAKMFYYKDNNFIQKYSLDLSKDELEKIISSLEKAIKDLGIKVDKVYGNTIENRQTQITYSAIGQDCPLEIKSAWDPDCKIRQKIRDYIKDDLSEFNVGIAGKSSIDITRKGVDKAFGIRKIEEELNIKKEEILFVGDMLMPGGNDYPVKEYGVNCISVKNPEDTKKNIKELLK